MRRRKKPKDALERMASYIDVLDNGCTAWSGGKDPDGYAMFWYKGKTGRAARILWEMLYGPIPKGLIVRHKCDNRECLAVQHLELGTHKDNTEDARKRGRLVGPRKINKEKAEQVNEMRELGMTIEEIAEAMKVSPSSIYNYLKAYNKRQGNYARGSDHWNYSHKLH